MTSELDIIEIIRHLENDDISKAKDIINSINKSDSHYDVGYIKALKGLISACENKERDSVFFKLVNNEISSQSIEIEREHCKKTIEQNFRPAEAIGFEHAWEFILSYFQGDTKTGLERYQQD